MTPDTPVLDAEPLARFTVSESKVNWETNSLREKAFHPDERREVSVFRIEALIHAQVTTLGETEFAAKQVGARPLIGWAEFPVSRLGETEDLFLDTEPDPEYPTHPCHANIRGWPDPALEKGRMKLLALYLADHHELKFTAYGEELRTQKVPN